MRDSRRAKRRIDFPGVLRGDRPGTFLALDSAEAGHDCYEHELGQFGSRQKCTMERKKKRRDLREYEVDRGLYTYLGEQGIRCDYGTGGLELQLRGVWWRPD